jgi:hypothetical protein
MVARSIPLEPDASSMSQDTYEDLEGNVNLVMDYEHIPWELLEVAKKLQVKWPKFRDQDIPSWVGEWDTCYHSSTLLRGARGELDKARKANDNMGVDALGAYWDDKVESYMNETSSSSLKVQAALVTAGLQVLNYKKLTLSVMHEFYEKENSYLWFNRPSDTDYKTAGDDLNSKLALVNASIADCTRQVNEANGVLENVKSKITADVAMFESKKITTWGPDRK